MKGVGAAALVGLLGATAADAADLRLDDALARARTVSPAVRAAEAGVAAARGRLRQARLFPSNPVVSADLARHKNGGDDNLDRGVELDQEVEVGGQRGLRITGAGHDVAHAEYLLADKRRTVDGEARRAFFGVAAAERKQKLVADRLAIARRVAEAARRRARSGDVGELDARLAELETTRAVTEQLAAETTRAKAAARLAAALGLEPDEPIAIATEVADAPPPAGEAVLVERALAERPDLAAASEERVRFESEAALARRRGWIPNPTFRGWFRHEQDVERIIGGGFSLPLPLFNREQGNEAELLAQASGAAAEVTRLQRSIPREVHTAVVHRQSATAAWERYQEDSLPAGRKAQELIERAYDGGYLGLPELLVQQDRLLQLRGAAIDTWLDLREAESEVIEAVGGEEAR